MADTEQTEQEVRTPRARAGDAREGASASGRSKRPRRRAPRASRKAIAAPRASGEKAVARKGGNGKVDAAKVAVRGGDRRRDAGGPHGGREGGRGERGERGDDRRGGDRGRFEGPPEIDIEKLISDPLYLDNQAHGVVSRMRDMDSGTKSQLRRLYNAVRRAVRAPENERQQQFVMLRARLAYTIARHSLRSLDSLEKLLLQVTRKNDARGYERFRDLFEAIVAYNE